MTGDTYRTAVGKLAVYSVRSSRGGSLTDTLWM